VNEIESKGWEGGRRAKQRYERSLIEEILVGCEDHLKK
jgi:hypothetical protein